MVVVDEVVVAVDEVLVFMVVVVVADVLVSFTWSVVDLFDSIHPDKSSAAAVNNSRASISLSL
ncbi:MAG: hypothetical protein B6U72_02625 [Candidatus Altiarchaeales archaeon ex4484_2]|nr:MAG: hypothetical protein B6U72_02625 [Candidatus Altiarchaeales archaeon ex4484_2]